MANINVRIDDKIKKEAEMVFENIGITPSAAINLFYKQVIRTNSIPFELKAEIPNEETLLALDELEKIENGNSEYEKFESVDDLMRDLLQ